MPDVPTAPATSLPEQRTAIVTGVGAPRGIGRVVARRLALDGWGLALVDISADGVEEFTTSLIEEGLTAFGVATDVSSPESVAAAFEAIDANLPPVVGLANLAGIPSPTPLAEVSLAEWDRVMAVNATGSFLMIQAAAPRMAAAGAGRIVNTSSITAIDGGGTFSKTAYAAAKAAVLGLTRGAARELGPMGITVNAILPGPIDTDIMGGPLDDERRATMAADIPVGRVGQPDDIAALVSFLLSGQAGFISGASMSIDGGKYIH